MFSLGGYLFSLLFAGAPIGIALAGATALLVLFDDFLTYSTLFEAFFSFLTKYTLVAIPFFIYAGFLMERTGLVGSLFKFADALVGWVPGGFAYAKPPGTQPTSASANLKRLPTNPVRSIKKPA